MRTFTLVVALLTALALIAGCGDDDRADPGSSDTATSSDTTDDSATASLDEGVAAVVDGEEITTASIDEHVEAFAENLRFAEQLEGSEGDAAREQLRAQVLSNVIQTTIVVAAADDLDRPVDDEDLADARRELEEQAGGPEALQEAMDQRGMTEALLDLDLLSLAALNNLEEALDEEAGETTDDTAPGDTPPGTEGLSPAQQRVQEHLTERLAEADITVDERFGEWDAQTGQIIPAGAAPASGEG